MSYYNSPHHTAPPSASVSAARRSGLVGFLMGILTPVIAGSIVFAVTTAQANKRPDIHDVQIAIDTYYALRVNPQDQKWAFDHLLTAAFQDSHDFNHDNAVWFDKLAQAYLNDIGPGGDADHFRTNMHYVFKSGEVVNEKGVFEVTLPGSPDMDQDVRPRSSPNQFCEPEERLALASCAK